MRATPLIIAIDGPAGAGKSTVAQRLAQKLGLAYFDSGATYRAAALNVLEKGISPDDSRSAAATATDCEIDLRTDPSDPRVLLDGRDVTSRIRTPEVTLAAAKVSRLPEVRAKLIALQRKFASWPGVVMEGRDIGTVVFPSAPLKVFLTAKADERAHRRLDDEAKRGRGATLAQTASEIAGRDRLDAERSQSPLIAASDAVIIDSTELSAEEVVDRIVDLARRMALI